MSRGARIRRFLRTAAANGLLLAGLVALTAGSYLASPPAGFVVGGILAVALALAIAQPRRRT